jgi:hypothetical protein
MRRFGGNNRLKESNLMKNSIDQQPPANNSRSLDLLFFICAVIFNLAISGLYIAVKFEKQYFLKACGLIVILLIIPFTITLVGYLKSKSQKKKVIMNLIILFYLVVELFLDYILKIPFRDILSIHIPYIIIFYAAAYSMIIVAWKTNLKRGLVVLSTFLILIICLIYMFS